MSCGWNKGRKGWVVGGAILEISELWAERGELQIIKGWKGNLLFNVTARLKIKLSFNCFMLL